MFYEHCMTRIMLCVLSQFVKVLLAFLKCFSTHACEVCTVGFIDCKFEK